MKISTHRYDSSECINWQARALNACVMKERVMLGKTKLGGRVMQQSFWMHREEPEFPALRGRRTADAVVVGGGMTGLTTAFWLCRAGLRVILLEADKLLCGASSRCAGIVSAAGTPAYARLEKTGGTALSSAYAQTQMAALHSLREMARQQGSGSGWQESEAQIIADSAEQAKLLEKEAEAMQRAGLAAGFSHATQCPFPAEGVLRVGNMATLHPLRYFRHIADLAVRQGVKIFEHSRVISLETNLAYTERGSVTAPYIIVATGFPIINMPGWYFARMTQSQSWLIPVEENVKFEGLFLAADGRYALRKLRDGALFQLNGGRIGDDSCMEARGVFDEVYAPLLGCGKANNLYAGIEAHTADGLPYIGPYSAKTPNLFVAAGYGGRGLLGSMVAAQAISAHVLGLHAGEYHIYSAQRKGQGKLAPTLAGRYLRGLLTRPSAPRCPHMGCRLTYNAQERIWECPCHGSRFSDIGRVINAPAVHDAKVQHGRRG